MSGSDLLDTKTYLSDPVLYSPSFCQVGDLGPVFIWVGRSTEGRASGMCRGISGVSRHGLRVCIACGALHGCCDVVRRSMLRGGRKVDSRPKMAEESCC
jgi:hypothetical protein